MVIRFVHEEYNSGGNGLRRRFGNLGTDEETADGRLGPSEYSPV